MRRNAKQDREGNSIQPGDVVRVVGVPDLTGMHPDARSLSSPVFHYLVGKYKRIVDFDRHGHAQLSFRIPSGPYRGLHSVWIEPSLLRLRGAARSQARS